MIHTEVGQHTVGARVNGELVPLRHELQNGDTVEIITSPPAQPHEDWLHILTHARARAARSATGCGQRRHTDSVALGREMLERELKRLRRRPGAPAIEEVARRASAAATWRRFYARVAEGQISLAQVAAEARARRREGLAERLAKGPLEALGLARKPAGGIRIQGLDNVMVNYARCCQPVPGDRVVGIVTLGRGVSVHRQDCPNTFGDRVPAERRVAVEWDVSLDAEVPGAAAGLRPRPRSCCSPTSPRRSRGLGEHPQRRHGRARTAGRAACSWSRCRTWRSCSEVIQAVRRVRA